MDTIIAINFIYIIWGLYTIPSFLQNDVTYIIQVDLGVTLSTFSAKKQTLTQKYKIDIAGIRTPNCGMEDIYLDHYDTAQQSTSRVWKRYLTLSLKKDSITMVKWTKYCYKRWLWKRYLTLSLKKESITMVKWTEYCYKRWLWKFGALAELDVVVANINVQLTAFA